VPPKRRTPVETAGAGSAPPEKKSWEPPPLPRCATSVSSRQELNRLEAVHQRRRLLAEEYGRLDFHGFGGDVDGLRAFLAHKYSGSSARGWRIAIAPDKLGLAPVTFQEFCAGMRRTGYAGHSKSLWRALTAGKSRVALWDFEPDLAEELDEMIQGLWTCFPNGALEAWKALRRKHVGRATWREFEDFFLDKEERELLPEDTVVELRRVFEMLDVSGRGSISRDDFRFLDHWAQLRLGKTVEEEPVVEEPESPEPWSPPPKRPPQEPGLVEFREYCERNFGSAARAWRVALDLKGRGVLSLGDLGKGCRGMGWKHSHSHLYSELCAAGGGVATLRALDPLAGAAMDSFRAALSEKLHGDVYSFWSGYLDRGDCGTARLADFVSAAVQELGVEVDAAKRVFLMLDTTCTGWIAVTELNFIHTFESSLPSLSMASTLTGSGKFGASGTFGSTEGRPNQNKMYTTGASSAPTLRNTGFSSVPTIRQMGATAPAFRSPSVTSRAMQHRNFAQSTMLKKRWLKDAVLDHCQKAAKEQEEISKERRRQHRREVRDLCPKEYKEIFRCTSSFYLEGVRKIKGLHTDAEEPEEGTESHENSSAAR